MAAAAATSTPSPTVLPFSAATAVQLRRRIQHPSFLSFTLPAKPNPSRLRISRRVFWVPIVSCIINEDSSEIDSPVTKDHDGTGASFDLKLPRRRLLVQFTCNACGGSTKRLVNRLAYERGTVFVQCAGCLQHHKLVDNLGLVVEYDLRNEVDEV
ncbi:DNL-type zinc finger protein-like protein [Drosera capensis]